MASKKRKAYQASYYGAQYAAENKRAFAGPLFLLACLWLAVIVSALAVVYSGYLVRQATDELESLRHRGSELKIISGQYQLEESTWANYARVEKLAVESLGMSVPSTEGMVMVKQR